MKNLLLLLISLLIVSPLRAEVDITDFIIKEDFYQVFDEELEVGEIDYQACSDGTIHKVSGKRVWPAAEHVKFCMESGPKLYRSIQNNTPWNSAAVEFGLGWTLAEAGWGHFLHKKTNYCYWGFSIDETPTKCNAKSVDEGVKQWRDYLTLPHDLPDYVVPKRAKHCAPHRNLVEQFKAKPGPYKYSTWYEKEDQMNLWLRAKPHVSKSPDHYNEHEYNSVVEVLTNAKGNLIQGEGACTYNAVQEDYARHIQMSAKNMFRWCKQVYSDLEYEEGVYTYIDEKPHYSEIKHLIENKDKYIMYNSDFITMLNKY